MARKQVSAAKLREVEPDSDDSTDEDEDLQQEQAKEPETPRVTDVLVRGRSAMPATMPENKRWGHWRAGIHWPGTEQKEVRVTVAQLDELKVDPNLALSFDPAEEAIARATTAPDVAAKQALIEAAEAELKAAEAAQRAEVAQLQARLHAANEAAARKRAELDQLRKGK